MKKRFEGVISSECPEGWNSKIRSNCWLDDNVLKVAKYSDTPFFYVTHKDYQCCEYKTLLNIFTYGHLKLKIPITVIGLPVSIDQPGFDGDIDRLIGDYQCRKGLFLMLNLVFPVVEPNKYAVGNTLCTSIFKNYFHSFDGYLQSMRSSYRRRIDKALEKGKTLTVKKLENSEYSDEIHQLYLNVLKRSRYPLETLEKEFFHNFDCDLYVFYYNSIPVSFFSIKQQNETLHFVFGGMDYSHRDRFDLYYNMLIKIIKIGIKLGVKKINFGQTAESTKCRLGCSLEKRIMIAFSGNKVLNLVLHCVAPFLEYKIPRNDYHVFK